jgi:tRNA-specific 2-thiouridylase
MADRARVLVAMSGGVDSSVAAALLKERGHDLVGVTFHLWDAQGEDAVGRCCAPEDRDDARRSCEHLGIPHYVLDEREAFREAVVEPFMDAYLAGLTPSPCVTCNQQVKLGRLLEVARTFGCDRVATGHYARLVPDGDRVRLLRGRDRRKDQSYFLYGVPQAVLSRMLFPLGDLDKGATREEGRRLGVPTWDKKDSQELCFVPDGDVGGFIARQRGAGGGAGRILDEAGQDLGAHPGIEHFTVGQRRGLHLGGQERPRYVLRVVPETRQVVVGDRGRLDGSTAEATEACWSGPVPRRPFAAQVQVRYRHRAAPATVTPAGERFRVAFDAPQRAITPGQAAVVYDGDAVIGGGVLA